MSDVWEEVLYTSSYNDVVLDILLVQDDVSRTLAVHEFLNVDGGQVNDHGERTRTTQCRIIFFEKSLSAVQREAVTGFNPGNHIDRFELFMKHARSPDTMEFIHPLTGSYPAKVRDLSFSAGAAERDTIMVDCTFVEDSISPKEIFSESNLDNWTQRNTVANTSSDLAAAAAASGITTSIPADAIAAVDSWQEAGASIRKVNQEMARLSSKISDEMEEFELATNIANYETYKQYTRLHNELVKVAAATRSQRSRVALVTLIVGQPLRTLLVKLYGAAESLNRYTEVLALNDVRDPSFLAAGTTIQYHVPELGKQKGLRSVA